MKLSSFTCILIVLTASIDVAHSKPITPIFKTIEANNSYAPMSEKWIQLLLSYSDYLSSKFANNTNLTDSQLKAFEMIRKKTFQEPSDDVRKSIVNAIVDVSQYRNNTNVNTGFIEDSSVLSILVEALADSNKEIRDNVFSYLLKFGRVDMLQKKSEAIKKKLLAYNYGNNTFLLALLNLSEQEKEVLLTQKQVPSIVRARMGDQEEEKKSISQFENASTYKEKFEAAEKLSYIGTANCAEALIKALSSNLMLEAAYEHVSIKYAILRNLGKIYPGNPLFTVEIGKIGALGDDRYGGTTAIAEFLRKVADWSLKAYKIKLEIDYTNLVIYKKILVKRH